MSSIDDNPQATEPVREIATSVFQFVFLKERIEVDGGGTMIYNIFAKTFLD